MLRAIGSNVSIVTNFGCEFNCWYCVWKGHYLKNCKTKTDWVKLEEFLRENKNKGKVSVSGGGDPLYHFDENQEWWNRFLSLCQSLEMKIDIHSRTKLVDANFWKRINKVVVSSDIPEEDYKYFVWVSKYTQLRISHVITKNTTRAIMNEYLKVQRKLNCQLTFKQLSGYPDDGMFEEYSYFYKEAFFLGDGDYNIYYMPDNSVSEKFLCSV